MNYRDSQGSGKARHAQKHHTSDKKRYGIVCTPYNFHSRESHYNNHSILYIQEIAQHVPFSIVLNRRDLIKTLGREKVMIRPSEMCIIHQHESTNRTTHRQLAHVTQTFGTLVITTAETQMASADTGKLPVTAPTQTYIFFA